MVFNPGDNLYDVLIVKRIEELGLNLNDVFEDSAVYRIEVYADIEKYKVMVGIKKYNITNNDVLFSDVVCSGTEYDSEFIVRKNELLQYKSTKIRPNYRISYTIIGDISHHMNTISLMMNDLVCDCDDGANSPFPRVRNKSAIIKKLILDCDSFDIKYGDSSDELMFY